MRAAADDYLSQLLALLPPGFAWSRESGDPMVEILAAIAPHLAALHNRAADLLEETDPRTTLELLREWESFAGLPGDCAAGINTTLQDRRRALWDQLTARGGQALAMFERIATVLGYSVTITPRGRPFICGHSRCGHRLGGEAGQRLYWKVTVHGARVTKFRTGASRCGDRLGKITRAEDLECRLRKLAPAHTVLIFAYEDAQ